MTTARRKSPRRILNVAVSEDGVDVARLETGESAQRQHHDRPQAADDGGYLDDRRLHDPDRPVRVNTGIRHGANPGE